MTTQLSARTSPKKVTSRPVSGRSSDSRCVRCMPSRRFISAATRVKEFQQWLKDNATSDGDNSPSHRLQRPGRPGVSPEFPVHVFLIAKHITTNRIVGERSYRILPCQTPEWMSWTLFFRSTLLRVFANATICKQMAKNGNKKLSPNLNRFSMLLSPKSLFQESRLHHAN